MPDDPLPPSPPPAGAPAGADAPPATTGASPPAGAGHAAQPPRNSLLGWPWRAIKALLTTLLALLILFEEWGWEPLQALLARLGRLPLLRQIEAAIGRAPPRLALALFLLPSALLLPVKLAALALIGHGHALAGVAVIVAAKLGGTAVLARLFALTRPALMQLAWFARLYTRWTAWKDALLARIRASAPWRLGRVIKRAARRRWRQLFA